MKKTLIVVSILCSAGGFAQTEVSAYSPGKSQENGITYALPKSVIEIEVEAVKVKYTPGEFAKYADRYMRLTGVSDEEKEYWEISNIRAISTGMPDPDNTFFVKLKDKTVAPLVELTPDGRLISINMAEENKKLIPATPLTPAKTKVRVNARDFMTREILTASSTAKMAELVAEEIDNIRESKNAIIRGQAENMPKDGESLKLMLSNLNTQEQAMLDMFTGITEKETKTFVIKLVPNKNMEKEILFRFSTKLGVVSVNDLVGAPIYINLTNLSTVPELDAKAKKEKEKKKPEGIVYNVPGKAQIQIFSPQKRFFEGDLMVTQFGNQETLDANLFDKKSNIKVSFYPETGAVNQVIK